MSEVYGVLAIVFVACFIGLFVAVAVAAEMENRRANRRASKRRTFTQSGWDAPADIGYWDDSTPSTAYGNGNADTRTARQHADDHRAAHYDAQTGEWNTPPRSDWTAYRAAHEAEVREQVEQVLDVDA